LEMACGKRTSPTHEAGRPLLNPSAKSSKKKVRL
jgi:hypothetical protein